MKTYITGKCNNAAISEQGFLLKRQARKDYKSFVRGNDNSDVFDRAFPKSSGSEFASLLLDGGAFSLQFDQIEKDEAIICDISYLLTNKRRSMLPKWFVHRLKGIEDGAHFVIHANKKRNHLDWNIQKWIGFNGYVEFVKAVLHALDSVTWGKEAIPDVTDIKKAEKSSDVDIVAAASYLITRGDVLSKNEIAEVEAHEPIEIKELITETINYQYHKQRFYEACLFGASFSSGFLTSTAYFSSYRKDAEAGVYFDRMYQQEDCVDRPRESINAHLSEQKRKMLREHMLLQESKAFGIPKTSFLSFKFYRDFSFSDIAQMEIAYKCHVAQSFANYHPNACGEMKSSDLQYELQYFFEDEQKCRSAYELTVNKPSDLMDLYQTPFIEIDDRLYFSCGLIRNNNFSRNMASSANKNKSASNKKNSSSAEDQKGLIFEKQVQKALLTKLEKVIQGTTYSIRINGTTEKSDIDILALEGGEIHVIECKSEMIPMDYYDYRRDKEVISYASYQIGRSILFLSTSGGKAKLIELFGEGADKLPISPCIVISNCRSACRQYTDFPIYSFYEIEMALKEGSLLCGGEQWSLKEKIKGVFPFLEKKILANILLRSVSTYPVYSRFCLIWTHKFQEFIADNIKLQNALSKTYAGYTYKRLSLIRRHKILLTFLLILVIPFAIRYTCVLILWIISLF